MTGEHSADENVATIIGDHWDYSGYIVHTDVGDVDVDGYDDVLVEDPTRSTHADADGGVFVYGGPLSGTLEPRDADVFMVGTGEGARASGGVIAELNGDAHPDLIARDYTDGRGSWAAYALYGPITADRSLADADITLLDETPTKPFPTWVWTGGDLDGDGVDELTVNVGTEIGIFLDLSPGTGSVDDADVVFAVDSGAGPTFYQGGGDMNGDGHQDLLIGAPWYSALAYQAGGVFLHHGPITASRCLESDAAAILGGFVPDAEVSAALWAGDVDGDGHEEVFSIADEANWRGVKAEGLAWLVRGPITGAVSLEAADVEFKSESGNEFAHLGSGGGPVGDVNADGLSDILIGEMGNDAAGNGAGAAWLFYGGSWVLGGVAPDTGS